jgi:hypothetical protein
LLAAAFCPTTKKRQMKSTHEFRKRGVQQKSTDIKAEFKRFDVKELKHWSDLEKKEAVAFLKRVKIRMNECINEAIDLCQQSCS